MRLIIRLVVNALALWLTFLLVPNLDFTGNVITIIIVAVIFGLVNAIIKPIVTILSCPLIVVTFGLFALVINFLMLWLTIWLSSIWDLGLHSEGILWTFIGSVVLSIVSWILGLILPDNND